MSSGWLSVPGSPGSADTTSGPSMRPSVRRNPTASSASCPGVRIVTATATGSWPGPWARISSGASPTIAVVAQLEPLAADGHDPAGRDVAGRRRVSLRPDTTRPPAPGPGRAASVAAASTASYRSPSAGEDVEPAGIRPGDRLRRPPRRTPRAGRRRGVGVGEAGIGRVGRRARPARGRRGRPCRRRSRGPRPRRSPRPRSRRSALSASALARAASIRARKARNAGRPPEPTAGGSVGSRLGLGRRRSRPARSGWASRDGDGGVARGRRRGARRRIRDHDRDVGRRRRGPVAEQLRRAARPRRRRPRWPGRRGASACPRVTAQRSRNTGAASGRRQWVELIACEVAAGVEQRHDVALLDGRHRVVLGEHVAGLVDVAGHGHDAVARRLGRPAQDELLGELVDEVRAVDVPAQVEPDERDPAPLLDRSRPRRAGSPASLDRWSPGSQAMVTPSGPRWRARTAA